MASPTSRNADQRRRSSASSSSSTKSFPFSNIPNHNQQQISTLKTANCCDTDNHDLTSMTVGGLLKTPFIDDNNNNNGASESTLLNAEFTVLDVAGSIAAIDASMAIEDPRPIADRKTVDEVWREIVAGKREQHRDCKTEVKDEEMMTLEDFLVKAGAVDDVDIKVSPSSQLPPPQTQRLSGGIFAMDIPSPYVGTPPAALEGGFMGFESGVEVTGGRGKRIAVSEQLDKVAAQRQRRMIKNRESAARSRERKQAYQIELESLAVKLEEENVQLLKEKVVRRKERYKQLMEKVIPMVESRRLPRALQRVSSVQW